MSRRLYDAIVRRSIYQLGLKKHAADRFSQPMQAMTRELVRAFDGLEFTSLGGLTQRDLRRLLRLVNAIARTHLDRYTQDFAQWLRDFVDVEAKDFNLTLNTILSEDRDDNGLLLIPGFRPKADPDGDTVWTFASSAVIVGTGMTAAQTMAQWRLNAVGRIAMVVTQGSALGWTRDQFVAAIQGTAADRFTSGVSSRLWATQASIADTVISSLSQNVQAFVARRITDQYQWVSVLDDRTTHICTTLDGQIFDYGHGPLPPAHINCRSDTVPYIVGQDIPDETWAQWRDQQPAEFREDAMRDPNGAAKTANAVPQTLDSYAEKGDLVTLP